MTREGSGTGSLIRIGIFADTTIMHVQGEEGYVHRPLCFASRRSQAPRATGVGRRLPGITGDGWALPAPGGAAGTGRGRWDLLPQQALVISLYLDFRSLNLLDSLVGLIVVYTAFALPVTIWMLRNFVAAVPREIEEAAAIDGAGPMRTFWRILLPLVAPGLVATSVFAFIFAYNEFIFALTFLGVDAAKFTLPIYVQYFYGRNGAAWGAIMAASTLFTIPVMAFFLLLQRRLTTGLVAGAVKG
jgi:hypothetical protein